MSHPLVQKRRFISATVAVATTGDKVVVPVSGPQKIYRWGIIANSIIDVGAAAIFSFEHRITAGSDTGRTVIDTISTGTTDVAAGKGLYSDLSNGFDGAQTGEDGKPRNIAPAQGTPNLPVVVRPGEELVFEVTDAPDTAGAGAYFFYEYSEEPWVGVTPLANMTLKNS